MDFLFADKPSGVTTHTSENKRARPSSRVFQRDGFKEHLEDRLQAKLFVVHRLDRETSGAIVFAKSAETAAQLAERFAEREVSKTYLFLTDRKASQSSLETSSFIERVGNEFISERRSTPNAKTTFKLVREQNGLSLWEARPETGRPHQIRLHARDLGIPILGDETYGGSLYPALCLHSSKLEFEFNDEKFSHSTPEPKWFESFEKNHELVTFLKALDRRERLIRSNCLSNDELSTLRWIHKEGDPLRVEKLGSVAVGGWFSDQHAPEDLEKVLSVCGSSKFYVMKRADRGADPNRNDWVLSQGEIPEKWVAQENGLNYEFRSSSGLSPGLFLDQRQNRKWVHANSRDLEVLNLFCYTGGFSVCAASGGAKKVVSVDLSKTFLEWAKSNFALNSLALDGHEFRAIDARVYLEWAIKKGLKFDLVICDPPSFSRGKDGIFKIEKDYRGLIDQLIRVTSKGGRILFSLNFEGWNEEEFHSKISESCGSRANISHTPAPDWDFELPSESPNMKSVFLDVR